MYFSIASTPSPISSIISQYAFLFTFAFSSIAFSNSFIWSCSILACSFFKFSNSFNFFFSSPDPPLQPFQPQPLFFSLLISSKYFSNSFNLSLLAFFSNAISSFI